ncbi:MAG: hypothetical protein ACRDTM_02395 [Micromonosporaceae bacterium]
MPTDQRPAVVVLGAVEFWLAQAQQQLLELGDRRALSWDQLTATAVAEAPAGRAGLLRSTVDAGEGAG